MLSALALAGVGAPCRRKYIGCLLINSYWVPQFFRNTLEEQKKDFSVGVRVWVVHGAGLSSQ